MKRYEYCKELVENRRYCIERSIKLDLFNIFIICSMKSDANMIAYDPSLQTLEYSDVFAVNPQNSKITQITEHIIETGRSRPVKGSKLSIIE